jgi:hypothetical protein
MAATIAEATGCDRQREKSTHRLGSEAAETTAATWNTFARAYVCKDGSGYVQVKRRGETIHRFDFGPE